MYVLLEQEAEKPAAAADVDGACPIGLRPLMSVARLDTCATVVDAASFWDNLQSIEDLSDRCVDV